MLIFFCAGRTSDMADLNPGAMDPSGEDKLDTSYDADDDGPDARLRRRERREAQKAAAELEKNEEDDEALLDASDTDDMDQGEVVPTQQVAPAAETAPATADMTQSAPPPPPEVQTTTPPTAPPTEPQPDPPTSAATGTNSGTDNPTGSNIDPDEIKKRFKKLRIELNFVNCGSSANLNGVEGQLKNNPANLSGAGKATPNPSGGVDLIGQSESVNSSYRSVSALRKSSLTNPSIMQGGRVEREANQIGSFAVKGDGRAALCHFRSVIEKKQNISTSFNPKTLSCGSCPARGEHPVGGEGGG